MENEFLNSLKNVLPVLGGLIQEDVSTCITDREKCIVSFIGNKVPINFKAGDPVPNDNPLFIAMETNQILSAVVPKAAYGIEFQAIAYPIADADGKVIGAVGVGKSLEKQALVENIASGVFHSLNQSGQAIEEIATGSQKLLEAINNIVSAAKDTINKIGESDVVMGSIQSVATKSNLLALNGAIEAARIGEAGKGFAVVAQEMRSLSLNSSKSTQEVLQLLKGMKNSIEDIMDQITEANMIAQNHAAATQEMNSTIDEIMELSKTLVDNAKII